MKQPESRVAIGREFESQAASFYKKQGYLVMARNWRAGKLEIDLIVQKDDLIVFVEVKGVGKQSLGHPAERVNKTKIGHLVTAAQQFLQDRQIFGVDLRFDVVTITDGTLEHFPDAFRAE